MYATRRHSEPRQSPPFAREVFDAESRVDVRPLRLAFTMASPPRGLNRATYIELVGSFFNRNAVIPPEPEGTGYGLRLLVSVRFQILFHRPPGLLFTFPSRYLFTIDHGKYLALRHSRRCFTRDFTSPALLTRIHSRGAVSFTYGAFTLFGRLFQAVPLDSASMMTLPGCHGHP